jgi:hypothetical protein
MVTATTFFTYVVVVLGLFLIPGPAVLLVLGRAMTGGATRRYRNGTWDRVRRPNSYVDGNGRSLGCTDDVSPSSLSDLTHYQGIG